MRISIAMATYNGEQYIREQLDSLAAQTLLPYELVVCDDGSSDDTVGIVQEFAQGAPFLVSLYQNQDNLGFADNFHKAASLCSGDWIGFCDQDDVWLPNKLTLVNALIQRDRANELMLVTHSAYLSDRDLRPSGRKLPSFQRSHTVGRFGHYGFWVIPGFACVFRAELVRCFEWSRRPRNYFPGHYWQTHDKWVCMLANVLGDVCCIARPLAYYRRHAGSLTGSYRAKPLSHRIKKSESVGADHYRFLCCVAHESAETLQELARSTENELWMRWLYQGAEKYLALAEMCSMRALIYEAKGFRLRAELLGKLLRAGGYFGDPFYAFGTLSFLKDVRFSCVP